MTHITATRVDDDAKRLQMLPKYLGANMVKGEGRVYDVMTVQCKAYNGGYWHMYVLSNGGFYMAPAMDCNVKLDYHVSTNGYSGQMTPDACGIAACLAAWNWLCWEHPHNNLYPDLFYRLKDFACQHPEGEEILRAID